MKKFHTVVLGLAAGAAVAFAATSADANGRRSIRDWPGPFSWTGFYVGALAGVAMGEAQQTDTILVTGPYDLEGQTLGGTVGYNLQSGSIVFGVEADFSWSNIDGLTTTLCPFRCTTHIDWLGTIRGRIGFTTSDSVFLVYLTGGVAFADVNTGAEVLHPWGASASETLWGWTAGGGLEARLSRQLSVKAEYLYVDLDDTITVATPTPTTTTLDPIHLGRVGLNFSF